MVFNWRCLFALIMLRQFAFLNSTTMAWCGVNA